MKDVSKKNSPNNNGKKTANVRNKHGQFKKGNKEGGRSKGSYNKTTLLLQSMGQETLVKAMENIKEAINNGDKDISIFLIKHMIPAAKSNSVELNIGKTVTPENLSEALDITIEHMKEGNITPDEALTVCNVLDRKRKFIETVNIEQRVSELEELQRKRTDYTS